MKSPLVVALVAALSAANCISRDRLNADCRWTGDARVPLDITRAGDVSHLANDAAIAEDLAIRYADTTRGRRSGHFAGWDEYAGAREQCMTRVFAAAADAHGVDPQQLRALVVRRPIAIDLAVIVVFAAMYAAACYAAAGVVFARFSPGAPASAIVASIAMAAASSVSGALVFGIWAGSIEMIRFGNMHMSYRADRLPWGHHPLALFAGGVVVFLSAAAWRAGRARASGKQPRCRITSETFWRSARR